MELPEILLIDKPSGMTSFDVIRVLRQKLNPKPEKTDPAYATWSRLKAGHAGTLDPLATGLMVLGLGKGTKKLAALIKLDKEYVAEIRVGEKRSTGDLEGAVLEKVIVSELDESQVRQELNGMLGILTLPVSAYSAIKKDGVPMYKRARKAEATGGLVEEVPYRDMEVLEVEFQSMVCEKEYCVVSARFYVGSGVYIRSLAEEFGKRMGYPATLQNLRRTKVGEFAVEDAQQLDTLKV